jgi:hypothetical protein
MNPETVLAVQLGYAAKAAPVRIITGGGFWRCRRWNPLAVFSHDSQSVRAAPTKIPSL